MPAGGRAAAKRAEDLGSVQPGMHKHAVQCSEYGVLSTERDAA